MKITVNPNNLADVVVEQWAINQDPEVGHEEPQQVAIDFAGKSYILKIYPGFSGPRIDLDVWSLTEDGQLNIPLKSFNIENN